MDSRVVVNLGDLTQTADAYAKHVPKTVGVGVRVWVHRLVAKVTKTKLLGQRLNRRTGTLIRSITASPSVEVTPSMVTGRLGSHLDYARLHELGYTGPVQVRAHVRRLAKLRIRAGKATKTSVREVKARLKAGRAMTANVRPHTRRVSFPALYYLRDTMTEEQPTGVGYVRDALLLLGRNKKPPGANEVRGGV